MIKTNVIRVSALFASAVLVIALFTAMIRVEALSSSSLLLSDSRPNATNVTFTFDTSSLTTASNIQCMQLDIGTAVDGSGNAGLDLSSVTLDSETIPSGDTWSVGSNDTEDILQATADAGGATPNASGNVVWGNITNGPTAGTTYFGLFETFNNTDCSTGGPIDSAVVTLLFRDGALVSLTIDPTLTFTVGAVSSSTAVNGVNTTITTTPTTVDFGNSVTTGTNGISAHDLTIGTNAGSYALYIRHTGLLTNGSSDTIDNLAGATNASPTAFSGAGTEAWGYTTEDSSLGGGTATRFTTPASGFAAFNTTNEIVADGTGPTASTVHTVGHQVGISAGTEAGTYQTTIVYTAASTY